MVSPGACSGRSVRRASRHAERGPQEGSSCVWRRHNRYVKIVIEGTDRGPAFLGRSMGESAKVRRVPVRRLIAKLLCVTLVAGCTQAASVAPLVSAPVSPSVVPLPGKEARPTPSLDSAMTAAVVSSAGVAASAAIWVIRGGLLAISTDFGTTWTTGSIPLPELGTIGPTTFVLDGEHAWSLTVPAGSGDGDHGQGPTFDHVHLVVNRTSDAGMSWQQATVPGDYPDTARSLFFLDPLHGFLMASGGRTNQGASTLLRTDDGGSSWTVVRTVPATETGDSSLGSLITATDGQTLWAAAEGEAGPVNHPILDVSRDGGLTWSRVALPGVVDRWGGTNNVPLGPPTFLDASTGYFSLLAADDVGLSPTLVFGTNDGGRTWSRLSRLPAILAGPIAFVDARHWLAVEQGLPSVIRVTDDGGATWSDLPAAGLSAGGLEWLSMLDGQRGVGVLLIEGNSDMPAVLMLASDGGKTWTPAGHLPSAGPSPTITPSPVTAIGEVSPSPVSSATPALGSPSAPPCRAADLRIHGGRGAGGTGTALAQVYFTNVGPAPCSLSGYPAATGLLRADGAALLIVAQAPGATPGPPVTLAAGAPDAASLAFNWENWCGSPPGPLRIRITLPNGGGEVSGGLDGPPGYDLVPRCDQPDMTSFTILLWTFAAPVGR